MKLSFPRIFYADLYTQSMPANVYLDFISLFSRINCNIERWECATMKYSIVCRLTGYAVAGSSIRHVREER